ESAVVAEELNRARRRAELTRAAMAHGAGAAADLAEDLRTIAALEALQTEGRAANDLPAGGVAGTAVNRPVAQQAGGAVRFGNRPAANPAGRAGGGGSSDVIQEIADLAPAPPVNNGNRLDSNRTENRSTLVVE